MVNFFYLDVDPKKCAQYYCNKHIIKIPIEIAQILSKIHHEIKSGIDYNKIYKNSLVVKNTIGPYMWAFESYDNYIWTCNLGLELINEYKFRYNKEEHKTESILQILLDHPPNLPKIGITKFRGTNKFDMFQFISKNPIVCARYHYSEMKCKNDYWKNRGSPEWFEKIKKSIYSKKEKLIEKINFQVRERLPSLVTKGDRVYRFHSFLRVSYDHLFQGKWDIKAKMMNVFDKTKPLLYQLTYPQLFFVYKITKSLENKKILNNLNVNSLRYRNKLDFPIKNFNYRINPEYYIYFSSLKGISEVEPYNNEIKLIENDSLKVYNLFLEYIKNNDLIGGDMVRKYIQSKKSDVIYLEKLILINNNTIYNEWINKFNWRVAEPYNPKNYIIK